MLMGALLLSAITAFGQESRQDVSVSGTGVFGPQVTGNAVHLTPTSTLGLLASYRYMLTPRSALELNYGFAQNSDKYVTSFIPNGRIHARQQELSAAYVYNLSFKRFNPFLEAGVGVAVLPAGDQRLRPVRQERLVHCENPHRRISSRGPGTLRSDEPAGAHRVLEQYQ